MTFQEFQDAVTARFPSVEWEFKNLPNGLYIADFHMPDPFAFRPAASVRFCTAPQSIRGKSGPWGFSLGGSLGYAPAEDTLEDSITEHTTVVASMMAAHTALQLNKET